MSAKEFETSKADDIREEPRKTAKGTKTVWSANQAEWLHST